MIPAFQRTLEEEALARLASAHPERAADVERLRGAWDLGLSAIDALLEQRLLSLAGYRALIAAAPRRHLTWGSFVVLGELGRGRAGVVYRARDARGRRVALKVLRAAHTGASPQRTQERFLREAALLRRLEHPGIVGLLDTGVEDQRLFLTTELIAGGTLPGPVDPDQAVSWTSALVEALAYAHGEGVLHRDLKPANVLLDELRPRLVDFGLARDLLSEEGLTASHTLLGSLGFVAPEQLGDARTADAASDVFGLSALLHHMLTGRPPFGARSLGELFREVQRGPAPLLDLGPLGGALDDLLIRGLNADPRLRPTLSELAHALDRLRR